MIPKIFLREIVEFLEISTTNLGHLGGKKGKHFKNKIFYRRAATHTYASVLTPIHKSILQICIHYSLISLFYNKKNKINKKKEPKIKLCTIGKAILNCIRKTECIAHRISGTSSVENLQNLLYITTYVLQFRSTANFTKKMSYRFPPTRI